MARSRYSTKLAKAAWHAIKVRRAGREYVTVRKTRDPRIKGGKLAFGPYRTKKKACGVAKYQYVGTGLPIKGCA